MCVMKPRPVVLPIQLSIADAVLLFLRSVVRAPVTLRRRSQSFRQKLILLISSFALTFYTHTFLFHCLSFIPISCFRLLSSLFLLLSLLYPAGSLFWIQEGSISFGLLCSVSMLLSPLFVFQNYFEDSLVLPVVDLYTFVLIPLLHFNGILGEKEDKCLCSVHYLEP